MFNYRMLNDLHLTHNNQLHMSHTLVRTVISNEKSLRLSSLSVFSNTFICLI